MAHYDPETLIVLRNVLDEVWATLPDGSKSEALKSERAQHIVKQAADGERDPVRLRASALSNAVGELQSKASLIAMSGTGQTEIGPAS
jgi:hypothetical protein